MKTLKVEAGEKKQKHKHLKFYLFSLEVETLS